MKKYHPYQKEDDRENGEKTSQKGKTQKDLEHISQSLLQVLRHDAPSIYLPEREPRKNKYMVRRTKMSITWDGFVKVSDLLDLPRFLESRMEIADVKEIVANDGQNRFTLKRDKVNENLMIRANGGHTFKLNGVKFRLFETKEDLAEVLVEILAHSALEVLGPPLPGGFYPVSKICSKLILFSQHSDEDIIRLCENDPRFRLETADTEHGTKFFVAAMPHEITFAHVEPDDKFQPIMEDLYSKQPATPPGGDSRLIKSTKKMQRYIQNLYLAEQSALDREEVLNNAFPKRLAHMPDMGCVKTYAVFTANPFRAYTTERIRVAVESGFDDLNVVSHIVDFLPDTNNCWQDDMRPDMEDYREFLDEVEDMIPKLRDPSTAQWAGMCSVEGFYNFSIRGFLSAGFRHQYDPETKDEELCLYSFLQCGKVYE